MRFPRSSLLAVTQTALWTLSLASGGANAADSALLHDLQACPDQAFALASSGTASGPRRGSYSREQPIQVSSNNASVAIDGDATVYGQVNVSQGDRLLTADNVRVDKLHDSIEIDGNVTYLDPEISVQGRTGRYLAGAAQISDAQFQMLQQASRGRAGSLRLDEQGVLNLEEVTYTTCPTGNSDWQIDAAVVQLDNAKHKGMARKARVRFKGVPLVYLPWMSFPVGSARQSGLLFPSIGNSSRGGLQVSAPFYANLAPNYDLTLEPTLYTRRGLNLFGELRLLTQNSRATLDGNFLPRDEVLGQRRNRIRLTDITELPGDWRLRIAAENVSDAAYFEDFAQGADGTSVAFLPRLLELSYRDEHWRSGMMLRNFQTIDTELSATERPYTELPRLYAQGSWQASSLPQLRYSFSSEAVDFQRTTGARGWRLDAQPGAQLNIEGMGYFLRPAVALRSTQYQLTDTTNGQPSSINRTLPVASVDSGLVFERATGRSGQRLITLEPRLLYLYVPYRNQDQLPVFDTGLPDLNSISLYRSNRYVGADRVGDANQLSAGMTVHLYSSERGTRYLSATFGQTVYLTQPRVLLPSEVASNQQSSDLVAQVELKAYQNWSVDLGLQWDHRDSRAQKSEARVQYRPDGGSVVNLGYRFQRDRLEQADVSAAWPVSNQWSLYGRMLYSLRDHGTIEQFAGLEYNSCCYGVRAVARNYVSSRTGERDTGIFLQLELKGLASVGTRADAFLERAIRGYSPASPKGSP